MRTIAVANQKGGCGKTTTTHTLGVHFAEGGYRVLMVDVDPQHSLTHSCGVKDAQGKSIAEVFGGAAPGKYRFKQIVRTIDDNLDLVPCTDRLAPVELQLVGRMGRENVLKQELELVAGDYDLALIDCPPSLGLMTINALVAAHGVLCPTQPAAQDLRGLGLFIQTMLGVKKQLNPELQLIGVVPTFVDLRTLHHKNILEQLRDSPLRMLPEIGRTIRITEAPAAGETILTFEPDNPQAHAYRELGREVETWLNAEAM
jgi:chromosome partitioning protein